MDGQIRHLSTANIVLMHSITQVMNDQQSESDESFYFVEDNK